MKLGKTTLNLFVITFLTQNPSVLADDGTGNQPCLHQDTLPACNIPENALLPDLMTVVPKHLSIQNKQQNEILRFSNGLANLGKGPWWLEPEFPHAVGGGSCQKAFQLITGPEHFVNRKILPTDEQIPAPSGSYAVRCEKGNFDFHETHNHWHIDNIGEFKVCSLNDFYVSEERCAPAVTTSGTPTVGIKFTFCLIDWYKLGSNHPNSDPTRNFFSCETGFQGISPGWVDQYHHATPGQEIDITGLPAGNYVLVSTVNVGAQSGNPVFSEEDLTNNSAFVKFTLTRSTNGNPSLDNVVGSCEDSSTYRSHIIQNVDKLIGYYPDLASDRNEIISDMCGDHNSNN